MQRPLSHTSLRWLPAMLAAVAAFQPAQHSLGQAKEPGQDKEQTAPGVLFRAAIPSAYVQFYISGEIGGEKHLIAIDTGAGITVFDQSLKKPDTRSLGKTNLTDSIGNTSLLEVFEGPSLKIQALENKRPPVVFLDLQALRTLSGSPAYAVLGMTDLSGGKLLADFGAKIVEFHTGDWKLSTPKAVEVALEKDSSTPIFTAAIGGQDSRFLIDTGSDGGIQLPAPVYDALAKSGYIEASSRTSKTGAVSGESAPMQNGRFLKGELMGKPLAGVPVVREEKRDRSLLGLEWLCGYAIEIDHKAGFFRYEPRPEVKSPISLQLTLGAIIFYQGGDAVVARLKPGGGAAERAGIRIGDIIEGIENLAKADLNMATLTELVQRKAGSTISVKVRRKDTGKTETLELKLDALDAR